MLYKFEFGLPCQQWGCSQMLSSVPREIIPIGPCSNYKNRKCNCCYECYSECCEHYQSDEYYGNI